MTSDNIIAHLARSRSRRNLCCPRYTPQGWFECDLAEISGAGFLREYEVKLTIGDFMADKLKAHRRGGVLKHDLLRQRAAAGPCQFWFVSPVGMLEVDAIPAWAGYIHIGKSSSGRLWEQEVRPAPRLHSVKVPDALIQHVRSVFYYRYWQLLEKLHRRVAK